MLSIISGTLARSSCMWSRSHVISQLLCAKDRRGTIAAARGPVETAHLYGAKSEGVAAKVTGVSFGTEKG